MGRSRVLAVVAGALCAFTAACAGVTTAVGGVQPASVPAALLDEAAKPTGTTETAVLAGGCFWGVQGVFEHVRGVRRAMSGYAGGAEQSAHYDEVSTGDTGHAESVQISYDPSQVSYGTLLQIYFAVAHDPTESDRQGPDVGTQYRSAIFPQNDEQRRVAEAYIAQLGRAGVFTAPIATKVEPDGDFFPAEAYHQDYLVDHPDDSYIAVNDIPKVHRLKNRYPALYRDQPVLADSAEG